MSKTEPKEVYSNQPYRNEFANVKRMQKILEEHNIKTEAYWRRCMGHKFPFLSFNINQKHLFGLVTTHPNGFWILGNGDRITVYKKETIDTARRAAKILKITLIVKYY